MRTVWKIVRACSQGEIPSAEMARQACDYLQRQAGLGEGSPAVQILTGALQGLLPEDRLRERAAAEVDHLLVRAKAQLLQSVQAVH